MKKYFIITGLSVLISWFATTYIVESILILTFLCAAAMISLLFD